MAVILSSSASTPLTRRKSVGKPRNPQSRLLARRGLEPLSLALALAHGGARALAAPSLTYEEALRQSAGGVDGGDFSLPDVEFSLPDVNFALPDLGLDGFFSFLTENPLVVAGAVAVVAVPVVLGQVLGGAKPYSVVSARSAYQKLLEEPDAQLVDIRSVKDAREAGSPDLREAKKKAVALPYNEENKDEFLRKLGLRFKDPENTTLIILDKSDGSSQQVAELVTANGFKAAYAVKDGAEGRRGWLNSNLPWISPKKGLSFNLGNLFGDSSDGLPLSIGLAAATGLGVFAYTEIETLLQILGSAAIIQLLASKLLYAEDRKKTLKQIEEFLNTKIAPKELVDEIKEIGQALLPTGGTPAAATTSSAPAADTTEVKAESAATETSASVNSAPVAEASTELPPARSRSLSPYPNYPDLKPPSSPSPSTP